MRDYLIRLMGGWTQKEMDFMRASYTTAETKRLACEIKVMLSKPLRESNGRFKSREGLST